MAAGNKEKKCPSCLENYGRVTSPARAFYGVILLVAQAYQGIMPQSRPDGSHPKQNTKTRCSMWEHLVNPSHKRLGGCFNCIQRLKRFLRPSTWFL